MAEDVEIKYGVKELLALQNETLKRIESKVDANALSQAEALGKLDTRVSLLESRPDLEDRVRSLESARDSEAGETSYRRYLWPLVVVVVIGVCSTLLPHFHY